MDNSEITPALLREDAERMRSSEYRKSIASMYYRAAAALEAEAQRLEQGERVDSRERDEQYTDDNGTVWLRPTAWAYAQSCRVRDDLRARLATLEARVKALAPVARRWCSQEHPDHYPAARAALAAIAAEQEASDE